MTDKANQMLGKAIADAREFIGLIRKQKITQTIVSHGFIVWNPVAGMGMGFDFKAISGGRKEATNAYVTGVASAPRFTKADATILANNIGCGPERVPGIAMFINDAIDKTIESQEEFIRNMQEIYQA